MQNLTDESINALVDRSSIERIHLSYCDNVSVGAIHYLLSRLHKLTHLSLTGVPAFRRPDLQEFCRSPPRDFNSHQRAAFCVYSGKGVQELRRHLNVLAELGDPAFPPLPLVPASTFDHPTLTTDPRRRRSGIQGPPAANVAPLLPQLNWQQPMIPPPAPAPITLNALATLNAQRGPAAAAHDAQAGPSRSRRAPANDDDDDEGTVRGVGERRFDAAHGDLASFQARAYRPIEPTRLTRHNNDGGRLSPVSPVASTSRRPMDVDDEAEGASDDMDEDR